jgi:hypothetical protein
VNQRWLFGRSSYRPPNEVIDTTIHDVCKIPDDTTAKAFVVRHHYAASYPAARWRFGLYRRGELAGVAVFSHPCNDRVLTNVFPVRATDAVELGRLVLLDEVEGNGESWFIARCFEALKRDGVFGILAFSDPIPRTTVAGNVVKPGHIGTIYQATNAAYLGRGNRRTLHLLPDGTVLNHRTAQKMIGGERSAGSGIAQLVRNGAPQPRHNEDLSTWGALWTRRLARPLPHPGNHRYAWTLRSKHRRLLPPSQPYPKAC